MKSKSKKQNIQEEEHDVPAQEHNEDDTQQQEEQGYDSDDDIEFEDEEVDSKSNGKRKKQQDTSNRGVIYVGHLPYGLEEVGLRKLFEQYGEVTRVKLVRSKKTARSKGYAFVEFLYRDVASIVAQNLHGYLMFGKQLVVKYLEGDNNSLRFRNAAKKFKYHPWKQIYTAKLNKPKTSTKAKKTVKELLKKEDLKRKQLKDLGINYEFPGFKGILNQVKIE